MNRRGFLGTFGAMAAAALTLDPEKLLWRPEAKTIFIPNCIIEAPAAEPVFYGWVQTQGVVKILVDSSRNREDWFTKEFEREKETAHFELYENGRRFLYAPCKETVLSGFIVTWADESKSQLRPCGPGDIPIGIKL